MTRFDESQTIDHLAEAGPPDPDLVDAIADAIVASHVVAPLVPAVPWIKSIQTIIEDNTAAFRAAACFPASDIDDLADASHFALDPDPRITGAARQSGVRAALSWRPASGEHCVDRGKACSVRCDRVRSDDRIDRCAL